jgi:hypothetical protein
VTRAGYYSLTRGARGLCVVLGLASRWGTCEDEGDGQSGGSAGECRDGVVLVLERCAATGWRQPALSSTTTTASSAYTALIAYDYQGAARVACADDDAHTAPPAMAVDEP